MEKCKLPFQFFLFPIFNSFALAILQSQLSAKLHIEHFQASSISTPLHSALKLEKSAISKVQKPIFCSRKKFKTTKNAIFGLFSGAKIDFLPFLKMQIMCFCTFEIALFSNLRALCHDEI